MEEADINAFTLANMPYFIAVNYQLLLAAQSPQEQVKLILHIYNLGLRALTVNLVNQYLIRDEDNLDHSPLNRLLRDKFDQLTTDKWEEIFFAALEAYKGRQNLLFLPELHDFYWDTTTLPYRERSEVKVSFDRLTQATLELKEKSLLPRDESGWNTLAGELRGYLLQILDGLSFLGKYDLIRVLDQNDTAYTYELHRGTRILIEHRPSPKHESLTHGWFYLRAGTDDFLRMDPLLVFWDKEPEESELIPVYIGVYDRMFHDRLQYLLVTADQKRDTREDILHFKEFMALLNSITQKKHHGEFELSWVELGNISEKITQQHMATVQLKYQKDLYLQREQVHEKFKAFLADSEKRGFVLVGKSGVGKSNFLLALDEELRQSRGDICVLMYDGANLRVSSTATITDIINRDFRDLVGPVRDLVGQQEVDIWRDIQKIGGIQQHQVLLCVDAINENPEPTELLRQLDELVRSPWPWLKIMFSSRPETWQSIKRGVKLAEKFYYREQEVELEPFSYSEQLESFSRQELPAVYAKYQRRFSLQTSYVGLSNELKETLRDPLNLWLLARTYKGQAIPASVKTSELIQQYVNTLHLNREDLQFLENELLPLMVRVGHYSNEITAEALNAAGGALYDMVFSDQKLSDGRIMNQSFSRLVEVDILVQQRMRSEHTTAIQFKYERFYEHFVGKRIAQLSVDQANRANFFREMIEATSTTPFLWGAVRNALAQEAKERGLDLLVQLCFTDQQRVKEMLVNVLVFLGQDERTQVETLLKRLVPEEKKAGEIQKIRQVMTKSTEEPDIRTRNARKIAIEVASQLKLIWVLQNAALQADSTMRAVAVRNSYYLWQHDRVAGFTILEHVAEKATAGLIPNFMAFESVMGLSAVIFFEHYQDKEVLSRLQTIWRTMIAKLFRIHESSSPWRGAVRSVIREQIISFAITVVFRLFRDLSAYNMLSYEAFNSFFQLGIAEKELYRNLVHYLDVDGMYSRIQMESDYLAVLKVDNILVSLITLMGLVAHACSAPLTFLPFLKQLFEEAKSDVSTYPYLTVIANVAMNVLYRDPMNDDVFDFFVYTAGICQEYYAKHPETYHNRLAEAPQASTMHPYILTQYRREGSVRTDWFETRIQAALTQNHLKFFDFLLNSEFPQVGIEDQVPAAALAALEVFFNSGNAQINQMIQVFLSRLRVHYPDEVDDFLEEQQASDEFRLQVQTHEPVERVGELIGLRAWSFARDGILLGSTELRSQFIGLVEKAADCKDTQEWMEYNMRLLVNLIYGSQVLHLGE